MKHLAITLLALVMCLPLQVVAAHDAQAEETPATEMDDMVVTATRTAEPLKDVPGRVEVITKEDLKEMPVQTVDQALSYISGVNVQRSYGLTSHSTTVSLRGVGSQQGRTLVLVDGVPQNSADMGSVNWNMINLEDIKRIEILKGPAAAVYGSNAMGGVINIITEKPTRRFQGSASASYGTNEDWDLRAVAAGRAFEEPRGFYARVSGRYHNNGGYYDVLPSDERWYTRKTFLDQQTIGVKMGYDFTETNNIEFKYTHDAQLVGEGTEYYVHNGQQRSYMTDAWQGRFNFSHEGWSGMLNGYFTDTNYGRVSEKLKGVNYSTIDTHVDRQNYGIMTNVSRTWGANLFTVGFDYAEGTMDGVDYYRTPTYPYWVDLGRMCSFGGFAQDQIRLLDDKLIFLLGIRYDNATAYNGKFDTNDPNMPGMNRHFPNKNWDSWSPRASLKYFFMDNLSAYLSYGRAFRAPTLDYMYRTGGTKNNITQLANPDLDPETIDSFEFGTDYSPVENLKLTGSVYYSIGSDFLYSVTTAPSVKQWKNISEVDIFGVELNAEYEPFKFTNYDLFKKFSLFANYTYNNSRIVRCSQNKALEGHLLSNTPQNTFNVGYTWLNRYLNNRVAVQYFGDSYDDMNYGYNTIQGHAVVNAKIWRNFDFLGKYGENFNIAFSVENLFDDRYYTVRSNSISNGVLSSNQNINDGRTMYLELSCKF